MSGYTHLRSISYLIITTWLQYNMLHKIQRVTEDGVLQVEEDRDKDMQCQ